MPANEDKYPRVLEAFLQLTTEDMSPEQKQLIWLALTEPGRARQIMGWLVNMAVISSGSQGKHCGGK
ncbi:MAG: hypothetical protein V3W14_04105 [Candidatus Neomarinimicrobiota bacterium]